MSPKSCYIKPIPDDGPKKKEIPFPRYNTKFVENREYDFYEKGWYGIDGYLYNVPPKVAKVTEAGYFCPDCGAKADKEHMHVCYQCFVWGISY
ncbi:MAG: hypothetical protein MUO97_03725 [Dehalococcoidia bacterium]|nr:hypothetical protein [Dehalococcoidia bacterium]